LETGNLEWLGRVGRTLYAAHLDGRLLRLLLDQPPVAGWRWQEAPEPMKHRADKGLTGCGCSEAKEAPIASRPETSGLPPDTQKFDHLIHKGGLYGQASQGYSEAHFRNGLWTEEVHGIRLTRALDRKLRACGEVHVEHPAASMVLSLGNGVVLTRGEEQNRLELLRVLEREEL
jgi:hypothetical protein